MSTDLDWPTGLPDPRVTYRRTIRGATVRVPFEAGYVQTREQNTRRIKIWNISLDCTRTQMELLESFFEDDAKAGAVSFNWTDPDEDVAYEVRFKEDSLPVPYLVVDRFRIDTVLEQV